MVPQTTVRYEKDIKPERLHDCWLSPLCIHQLHSNLAWLLCSATSESGQTHLSTVLWSLWARLLNFQRLFQLLRLNICCADRQEFTAMLVRSLEDSRGNASNLSFLHITSWHWVRMSATCYITACKLHQYIDGDQDVTALQMRTKQHWMHM